MSGIYKYTLEGHRGIREAMDEHSFILTLYKVSDSHPECSLLSQTPLRHFVLIEDVRVQVE